MNLGVSSMCWSTSLREHHSLISSSVRLRCSGTTGMQIGDFFRVWRTRSRTRTAEEANELEPSRKSAALSLDCFRILTLVQTLSKEGACMKAMMKVIVEAVVMVFSASESDISLQEMEGVKKAAMTTFSHLAQIPSLAIHLKEVLVEMPVSRRQTFRELSLLQWKKTSLLR